MDFQVKTNRKVKGVRQKLKLFRANEPLKSVIMWGISYSFEQLNHVNKRTMLLPDDFKSYLKVKVDNHLFNKDSMPSKFQFKEYCPLVFADLRAKFGVSPSEFQSCWTERQPHWDCSLGRSGARFLCAHNRRYVLRVISCEDVEQVHQLLQFYHGYIVERAAATLLPQYLAMYRASVEDTHYYMLMMRSMFSPRFKIHRKYDLKGSTIDREASEKERVKELPTFKDVDFVNTGERIDVGPSEKARLLEVLRSDTEFLQRRHLMDYSLLVGMHDCRVGGRGCVGDEEDFDGEFSDGEEEDGEGEGDGDGEVEGEGEVATADGGQDCLNSADASSSSPPPPSELHPQLEKFAVVSASGQWVYFIGIISILTKYGVRKRTAQTYKSMKHGHGNENQLSTVKPDVYARRFMDFVEASLQ